MKKINFVTFLAALSFLAIGCQKEEIASAPTPSVVELSADTYLMQYTIDGVNHYAVLHGDAERANFLHQMFALAEEGRQVTFRDQSRQVSAQPTKEELTFSSSSKEEAYAWAEDKMREFGISFS